MNDEEMKHLWQTQAVPELGADVAALVTEARDKHRKLQRTIFWRDFREVGIAILMIPVWIYGTMRRQDPWTGYVMVLALVFIAAFMVIDRLRRKTATTPLSETVVEALGGARREVEHQIWLLRNVLWWYLGPLFAGFLAPEIHRLLQGRETVTDFLWELVIDLLVTVGVWWINHIAVKRVLVPRQEELRTLLEQIR